MRAFNNAMQLNGCLTPDSHSSIIFNNSYYHRNILSSFPREFIDLSSINFFFFPFSLPSWRRQWHPTPVLLPGKSHGRRSLEGYSPWGCKESDMTKRLHFHAPPNPGWGGWESPWAPCAPSHGVGVGGR